MTIMQPKSSRYVQNRCADDSASTTTSGASAPKELQPDDLYDDRSYTLSCTILDTWTINEYRPYVASRVAYANNTLYVGGYPWNDRTYRCTLHRLVRGAAPVLTQGSTRNPGEIVPSISRYVTPSGGGDSVGIGVSPTVTITTTVSGGVPSATMSSTNLSEVAEYATFSQITLSGRVIYVPFYGPHGLIADGGGLPTQNLLSGLPDPLQIQGVISRDGDSGYIFVTGRDKGGAWYVIPYTDGVLDAPQEAPYTVYQGGMARGGMNGNEHPYSAVVVYKNDSPAGIGRVNADGSLGLLSPPDGMRFFWRDYPDVFQPLHVPGLAFESGINEPPLSWVHMDDTATRGYRLIRTPFTYVDLRYTNVVDLFEGQQTPVVTVTDDKLLAGEIHNADDGIVRPAPKFLGRVGGLISSADGSYTQASVWYERDNGVVTLALITATPYTPVPPPTGAKVTTYRQRSTW